MRVEQSFDVLVVGAGHAGAEAAVAAARRGATVGLITTAIETIGQMSCNPAIGGIAKGTVVREIDALGGIMARATDEASLQFRMLNRSKGPAVWAPRSQCDRGLYRRAVRSLLEKHLNISIIQATVARLVLDATGRKILGAETIEGRCFGARALVITTGTFLRGRIHIGTQTTMSGGRAGEHSAIDLPRQLDAIGLEAHRFKTGTPPRIDGRSVDTTHLERQDSEVDLFDYSWSHWWDAPRSTAHSTRHPAQLPCWITRTGHEAKSLIRNNIGLSAMYGGVIAAAGPRYCPSVEDKIVRFPDVESHQIFLEPEGHDTAEMYVNGMSTSLPPDIQLSVLRTIPGLEQVRMTRAGYAIEYDYYSPTQLDATLRVREMEGLYFAGQINGTTGYEEAAGQGLVAGLNAAASACDLPEIILGRETSYIGLLIDDLTSRGVDEPYRLFTSRSEFRLITRQDNALSRLAAIGLSAGLYGAEEEAHLRVRLELEHRVMDLARETVAAPLQVESVLARIGTHQIKQPTKLAELARRPGVVLAELFQSVGVGEDIPRHAFETPEIELKYEGYFARERAQAARLQTLSDFKIPDDLAYDGLRTLAIEARQKLNARRPQTLAQASRIPGINPSDLQNLVVEIERRRMRNE